MFCLEARLRLSSRGDALVGFDALSALSFPEGSAALPASWNGMMVVV
jgi:hypothetical protein